MLKPRHRTREVKIGNITIGGDNRVAVQSMCMTHTPDVKATVEQIKRLEEARCDIVRVTGPDKESVLALPEIKKQISIPLVADIHFNFRMALDAMETGAIDKIRINPGNIGDSARFREVLREAKARNIPIRIGVNSGSLEEDLIEKYHGVTPQGMIESAMRQVELLGEEDYHNAVFSLKATDVPFMIEAYRGFAALSDYPLHLGVTEAGPVGAGTVKSAIGIGTLLADGIGDTIRVSLTADVVEEIKTGFSILRSLNLYNDGVNIIACPTCGRIQVDLVKLVAEVERRVSHIRKSINVALMGCAVNGPGESREADIGVACGKGSGLLFRNGEVVRKIKEEEIVDVLVAEIEAWEPNSANEKPKHTPIMLMNG
ncbi:MAG: flavodoxin-dependent (E)-4-hydroxy-3-methylbut-2-enyl-diphosphate synthase [bacterium]|nr:flavodoxin-dependent (E)-4-hydroxy-3-methylbut-2-enyl-diphosphate synthase [bacterium]